ncbi:MAG: response regulator transcription factor [Kiritimatiellia bacterium]|jgi:two-component system alkaline phosphatase synthesis response regulator PhoP
MRKQRILVVEDDPDIGELEKCILEDEGFQVDVCTSAEEAEASIARALPALVLLDLMLPGRDGLSFCRLLRAEPRTAHLPIIMVSARSENAKIVAGLEIGADDYVTKPFSADVLAARVRAVLRRYADREATDASTKQILSDSGVELDSLRMRASVDGEEISLTLGEFRMLELFLRRPGIAFTRKQIVDIVHGEDYPVTDRAVDVQIVGLRRKLGESGSMIETLRGVGYRWKA